ncbi:MAG TPA: proton-conducting transporter membrane subunit, partial [Actinotalea sp.]|nr:proton-conducting transporter membrane subunit [Actinotalea sp.]
LLGTAALLGPWSGLVRWSGVATSAAALAAGVALLWLTPEGAAPPELGGGLLAADALSAFMLATIGAVGLTATWGGLTRRDRDAAPGAPTRSQRRYAALVCVFLGAMSLAVLTDNLGVLWVAVEATTIATAFLVGHQGTRRSLEAAWKYVVLGSVGVAIALLGVVLLYAASRSAGDATLSWAVLSSGELPLDPGLVRVAVGLAVLGFATKAGLAPMHSWLPDAHSQAPAPVSGLMSGVLLAVAFYAILRIQVIADVVLGPDLVRGMLLVGGLLSLAVAAALVLRQRDYKRMLAYSSIEHMGLLALGAAVGGRLALAAVLLHVLGHGLAKATLFVVAGRILAAEGSTRIEDVRALLARRPDLAVPFVAGMAALLGFPPFALFFSEVAIAVAGWQAGLGWAMGAALALLLVLFAGLSRATAAMVLGAPGDASRRSPGDGRAVPDLQGGPGVDRGGEHAVDLAASRGPMVPLALALTVTAVAGFLAVPIGTVLLRAVAAVGA